MTYLNNTSDTTNFVTDTNDEDQMSGPRNSLIEKLIFHNMIVCDLILILNEL